MLGSVGTLPSSWADGLLMWGMWARPIAQNWPGTLGDNVMPFTRDQSAWLQLQFGKTKKLLQTSQTAIETKLDTLPDKLNIKFAPIRRELNKVHAGITGTQTLVEHVGDTTSHLYAFESARIIAGGLTSSAESYYNLANAVTAGRQREAAAEGIRASATALQTVMAFIALIPGAQAAGVVGEITGSLFQMIGFFIGSTELAQQSVADQVEGRLRKLVAEEKEDHLEAILTIFSIQEAQLEAVKTQSVENWADIIKLATLLGGGGELIHLISVPAWLMREENQSIAAWEDVYDGYLLALQQYMSLTLTAISRLKTSLAGGEVNDKQMAIAHAFLRTFLEHEQENLAKLDKIATNWGRFWHIGDGNRLYYSSRHLLDNGADWHADVQWAKRTALGPRDRSWILGENDCLFTKTDGGGWDNIPANLIQQVRGFCVAFAAYEKVEKVDPKEFREVALDEVHFIDRDAKVRFFTFDANGHGSVDERIDLNAIPRHKPVLRGGFTQAACDNQGRLFGLDDHSVVYIYDEDGEGTLCDGKGSPIRKSGTPGSCMIGVGPDVIFLSDGSTIDKFTISKLERKANDNNWYAVKSSFETLEQPMVGDGSGGAMKYADIAAMPDGSLLAIIGTSIYLWHSGEWRRDREGAERAYPVRAFRVCGRPAKGWESMILVRDVLSELMAKRDELGPVLQ